MSYEVTDDQLSRLQAVLESLGVPDTEAVVDRLRPVVERIALEAREDILLELRKAQTARRQALRLYLPERNIALEAHLREIDHVIRKA